MNNQYGWDRCQLQNELELLRKNKNNSFQISAYNEMINLLDTKKEATASKHKSFLRVMFNALTLYERVNYNKVELEYLKEMALSITQMPYLPQTKLADLN